MNSEKIKNLKKKLKLTKEQKSLIIGKLLGDGHLETQNNGRTYRLKIEHSIKQKDYVLWLFEKFKPWIGNQIYTKTYSKSLEKIGFQTYSHGKLRFYGQQFYKSNKKIIPKNFSKLIDELSLAIWFMDDGSRKSLKHNTYIIHSLGYEKKDLMMVCEVLKNKFDLDFKLHKQKQKYWRMYLKSNSVKKFEKIIMPYLLKFRSMNHKIGNTNA